MGDSRRTRVLYSQGPPERAVAETLAPAKPEKKRTKADTPGRPRRLRGGLRPAPPPPQHPAEGREGRGRRGVPFTHPAALGLAVLDLDVRRGDAGVEALAAVEPGVDAGLAGRGVDDLQGQGVVAPLPLDPGADLARAA